MLFTHKISTTSKFQNFRFILIKEDILPKNFDITAQVTAVKTFKINYNIQINMHALC